MPADPPRADAPRSVLFVTTETSGSQSLWRILSAIVKGSLVPTTPAGRDGAKPSLDDLEPTGRLYLIRGVGDFQGPAYDPAFRYVVNVRDPRDMLCNQYYWLVQHPINGKSSEAEVEEARARQQRIFDGGIDAAVLLNDKTRSYRLALEIIDRPDAEKLVVSYNQLCCGFDGMTERLADFLGFPRTKHAERVIAGERPENLAGNERWIGQKWFGTDVMPGRHRTELKPETVAALDRRYAPLLERLRAVERPELRRFYDLSGPAAEPAGDPPASERRIA